MKLPLRLCPLGYGHSTHVWELTGVPEGIYLCAGQPFSNGADPADFLSDPDDREQHSTRALNSIRERLEETMRNDGPHIRSVNGVKLVREVDTLLRQSPNPDFTARAERLKRDIASRIFSVTMGDST